jgi:outer membrane protein
MNNIFPLVLVVAASVYSHAQTASGKRMAGGTLHYSSYSHRTGTASVSKSFTISPTFGYFFQDNFAIGSGITLERSRSGSGAGRSTSNMFSVGPFARYYKYSSNERFAFFGQAAFHFGFSSGHTASGDVTRGRATTFILSPGAAYFLTEHWAVELLLTGLLLRSGNSDVSNRSTRYNTFYFDIRSFSPELGFHYHF